MRDRMVSILAEHTRRSVEQVKADIDRERFMTPNEARDYGLVDDVIERPGATAPLP
jgi:ATP-dependent Clp protease protease subunit